ncbi:MAG: 4-hydroxybenzoate octaprenyltransferase [Bacteroidota bacterium]
MPTIYNYLSFVKFSHTVFAMPFALIGYFTAIYPRGYAFEWETLMLIVLCMIFARNAAMGFNRYIDRKFDALNPRTAQREIPEKVISPRSALIFVFINSIAFITATWFLNMLCFVLSPVALLVVLGYSYTKRYTWLCHLVLGIGLSLAPIGAYIAVTGIFDFVIIMYGFTVLFWVAGFDIIYAINDREFDVKHNLYSIPAFFGKKKAHIISALFHLLAALLIITIAQIESFEIIARMSTGIFIFLLILQHFVVLQRKYHINKVFFITNGLASIILSAGLIVEMIIYY